MSASSSRPPIDRCPDPLAITRAVSQTLDQADPLLRAHLNLCAACYRQFLSESEISALAKLLPHDRPTPDRRHHQRVALLTATRAQRLTKVRALRQGGRVLGVGVAGLAVVWGLWVLMGRGGVGDGGVGVGTPAVRPPAVIDARPGTRYTALAGPPHEKVRLEAGSLRISVEPATHGETFQVITARGEVEVRGTVFETVATSAGLVAVRVERGKVLVRPDPGVELALPAGASWTRPPEPRPRAAVTPGSSRRPPVRPATAGELALPPRSASWGPDLRPPPLAVRRGPAAVVAAHDDTDTPDQLAAQAFNDGLALLRAGSLAQAARAFDRVAAMSPAGPLAEDAGYWRAVALARVGNKAAARQAQGEFLARFPLSPRAGEVSVMLGWLLLDGSPGDAEPRFRAGLADRSPRVQQSARDGLAALKSAAP